VSQPASDSYKGRLAILADGGCNSSCEDFVMPFKDNSRALVVGETTGGSSGQPFMQDLGNEMMLVVGTKRESFPDGARFEGVGIRPDVEVRVKIADSQQHQDVVLQEAIRHLTQARF
jgi:carboxyl-terminal processing protease